jgi:hypothetical protein
VRDQVSHPYKTTGKIIPACTTMKKYHPLKLQYISSRIHGAISYKTAVFVVITVRPQISPWLEVFMLNYTSWLGQLQSL